MCNFPTWDALGLIESNLLSNSFPLFNTHYQPYQPIPISEKRCILMSSNELLCLPDATTEATLFKPFYSKDRRQTRAETRGVLSWIFSQVSIINMIKMIRENPKLLPSQYYRPTKVPKKHLKYQFWKINHNMTDETL